MLQTTDKAARGQVSADAATVYAEKFVPALFAEWAAPVVDAAKIRPGAHVLDVACGTGVAAIEAARRVGPEGAVVGLDPNEGMLAIARREAPQVDWREGTAESLPFADDTFDVVLCQFGIMFFNDRPRGLKEMTRVLRRGGRAVATVWQSLEESAAFSKMVVLLDKIIGREAGDALRAPFAWGDRAALRPLLQEGGWGEAILFERQGTARFASMAEWVHVNVRGWAFSELVSEEQEAALLEAATREIADVIAPDGGVAFPIRAHIITLIR